MEDPSLKDEALLKLIEKFKSRSWNPQIIEKQYREVKLFLFQFDIKAGGPNAVTADSMYYKYFKTKHLNTAMGRRRFSQLLRVFLPFKITRGIPVFKIDATKIGLPPEYSLYKDPRFDNRMGRKSSYIGVYPAPWNEWYAEIEIDKVMWLIGFFDTSRSAAIAYNRAARYVYGKKAKVNKINGKRRKLLKDWKKADKKRAMAKLKRKKASLQSQGIS